MMAVPGHSEDVVAFAEAVPPAFSFLQTDYHARLRRTDDHTFAAATEDWRVECQLDWSSLVVSMRPARRLVPPDGYRGALGLFAILTCMHPELHVGLSVESRGMTAGQVKSLARESADLLREYCADFLRGDFARWPTTSQIEEYRRRCF